MAKITLPHIFSNLDSFDEFKRFVSAFLDRLQDEFNGKIDFSGNIRTAGPYLVSFANGTTFIQVQHSLGFIPSGILPIKVGATAAILYAAPGASLAWTSSVIYLRASTGCTASIFVI